MKSVIQPLFLQLICFVSISCVITFFACGESEDCNLYVLRNSNSVYSDSLDKDTLLLTVSTGCVHKEKMSYKRVRILQKSNQDTLFNALIRDGDNQSYYLVYNKFIKKEDTLYYSFKNISTVSYNTSGLVLVKVEETFSDYNFFASPDLMTHYYFRMNTDGDITTIWSKENDSGPLRKL